MMTFGTRNEIEQLKKRRETVQQELDILRADPVLAEGERRVADLNAVLADEDVSPLVYARAKRELPEAQAEIAAGRAVLESARLEGREHLGRLDSQLSELARTAFIEETQATFDRLRVAIVAARDLAEDLEARRARLSLEAGAEVQDAATAMAVQRLSTLVALIELDRGLPAHEVRNELGRLATARQSRRMVRPTGSAGHG